MVPHKGKIAYLSFFSISGEPQQLKHRQLQQQQQLKPGQQLAERQQQLQPFGLGGATVRTNGKKIEEG